MRAALFLVPLLLVAACTAAESPAGDLGSTTSKVTSSCKASRAQLLAATSSERQEVISRGLAWLDAKVPYRQSAMHEGFRTDCSGFVSMCWNLKQSYTTAAFAAGTADNKLLGSYEDLLPGDGFVRRSGSIGHVVLFVGWDDDAHTNACVLEEADTASDMQFGVRAVSSLTSQGFKAIRSNTLPDTDTPAAAATSDDAASADADGADVDTEVNEPTPASESTRAGAACRDDETCNPSFTGTGLVCLRGVCAPGCHFDLQCPDKQLCGEANQCE